MEYERKEAISKKTITPIAYRMKKLHYQDVFLTIPYDKIILAESNVEQELQKS